MASIYLYDIDLLHSTRFAPPNLELMKVFNYHYQRGDIVKMGMPKENDLGRYNQIIYFFCLLLYILFCKQWVLFILMKKSAFYINLMYN